MYSDRVQTLLARWQRFVELVEVEYDMSIYDYTNELCYRDEAQGSLAPASQENAALLARYSELDDRFRNSTREVHEALPGAPFNGRWWWFRVPLAPGGELRGDLDRRGLGDEGSNQW